MRFLIFELNDTVKQLRAQNENRNYEKIEIKIIEKRAYYAPGDMKNITTYLAWQPHKITRRPTKMNFEIDHLNICFYANTDIKSERILFNIF